MDPTLSAEHSAWVYFIATVLAISIVAGSLALAISFNVGATDIGPVTGAAWAWCVGAGTMLWVVPRVKEALSEGNSDL